MDASFRKASALRLRHDEGETANTMPRLRPAQVSEMKMMETAIRTGQLELVKHSDLARCSPIFAMGLLLGFSNQTASRRSVVWRPRERPPRAVARLVPVPWFISIARPVKVPVVTPGIIARSTGTRRGSPRHARFLTLRLRSRRAIRRDCYCIVERLSRGRVLHRGSLGEHGSTGRTLRRRGRGKLARLWTGRRRGWSFLFSGILRFRRQFDLLRLSRLLRRDRGARCH